MSIQSRCLRLLVGAASVILLTDCSRAPTDQPQQKPQTSNYEADIKMAVVRDLKLGMPAEDANKIASTMGPLTSGSLGKTALFKDGTSTLTLPFSYLAYSSYSNAGHGTKEEAVEKLTLSFTVPVPGATESKLYKIDYDTHFGEGIDAERLKSDLKTKYNLTQDEYKIIGQEQEERDILTRDVSTLAGVHFFVLINRGGHHPGSLSIVLEDTKTRDAQREVVSDYLRKLESERKKDTTQPKF